MINAPKAQYSEHEAAQMLGITTDELRSLVKAHIVKDDDAASAGVASCYQAADLVVLRVLSRMMSPEEIALA